MHHLPITAQDEELIEAARETLRRGYRPGRHGVAAAVRCESERIYTGVNIEAIHGPCAEPVALGAAFANGERVIACMVAVVISDEEPYPVLSPCGNCRQMLLDYCPDAAVIYRDGDEVRKDCMTDLLPGAYHLDLDG
jgi:cytidine deaminase